MQVRLLHEHPVLVWMLILHNLLMKPALPYKTRDDNSQTNMKSVNYVIKHNPFQITGSDAPEQPSVSHLFQSEAGLLQRAVSS